jgi:GR25 family glycosyltransferase involved in LPS biosynthesis
MTRTLNLYILHAEFLAVRKPMIETLVKKINETRSSTQVNVKYVTEHDPQNIQLDKIRQLIDLSKPSGGQTNADIFDALVKNIHIKQLSNVLKHYEALKLASETTDDSISLVLEDDVVFGEDVAEKLYQVIDDIEKKRDEWDAVFLGLPQPMDAKTEAKMRPVSEVFRIMPCVESYLVHNKGAKKLLEAFLPIRYMANVHYSYIINKVKDVKVLMTVSNVFVDGTKLGVYLSTLDSNNKLFLNGDYNKLQQIVNKDKLNTQDISDAREILDKMRFKNHPDNITLNAILEMKTQNYVKAKEMFENAYEMYNNNECILNNESEFLLHYTRIFKYTQEMP